MPSTVARRPPQKPRIGPGEILPPLFLEAAFIAYQKARLAEFLQGGAVRESLFSAARFIVAGLMLEGVFYGAALWLMPNMRGDKVVVGRNHHELYYAGMAETDAAALAAALESMDHLKGPRQMFLKAVRSDGNLTLYFPEARDWADLEVLAEYSLLLDDLGRVGIQPARGCFFHDPYTLADTSCFGRGDIPLLEPIRNRRLESKLDVLAKVRGEVRFFRALFEEADRKRKKYVTYARIPSLLVFAANGIATVDSRSIPDGLAESYGNRENAILGVRILVFAFQGLKWPDGDNRYLQYMEALDRLQANLGKVSDAWAHDGALGNANGP